MIQILLIFLVIALMNVCVALAEKHLPPEKARRLFCAAFAVYVLGNLYFTLLSRTVGSGTYVDLRPFGSYLRLFESIQVDFENATGFAALFLKDASPITSIVLNVFLYYPLGFLLPVLFPGLKGWQVVLIGFTASAATEVAQYLLEMGWVELDDVINNTTGTAIGLWIGRFQTAHFSERK